MLSIARSKFAFLSQLGFVVLNAVGFLVGINYNANTPDLYENNSHSKLGWLLTVFVTVYALLSAMTTYLPTSRRTPHAASVIYQPIGQFQEPSPNRDSRDSGQGTEPPSPGDLMSPPSDTLDREAFAIKYHVNHFEDEELDEKKSTGIEAVDRFLTRMLSTSGAAHVLRVVRIFCDVVDRLILILGFVAICTGVAVWGGHFVSVSSAFSLQS